jgi:outer membrane protein OmpA-like peptidoglycan-associated protein
MHLATKYLTVLFISLLATLSLQAQEPAPAPVAPTADSLMPRSGFLIDTVYFGFDSEVLKDDSKAALDSMIGIFTAYPAYYVEVLGHTDSVGPTAYNLILSEQRARNVALYLVEQGVALDRIVYEGLGTEKPVASNLSYAGRRKNRRTDVAVVFSTETVEPVYTFGPQVSENDSAEQANQEPVVMVDTIRCGYEPFFINPLRTTLVIAPQGTELTIPPGAFDTDEEEVEISVGELFSRRDMIVAQMGTLTRDGTLETSGMFSFEARAKSRPIKVRDSVSFEVSLPSTRRDNKMSIYQGRAVRRRTSRRGSSKEAVVPGDKPSMTAVQEWMEVEKPNLRYNGRDKAYFFKVDATGSYAVGRPLHEATITDREDKGIDIRVKLKGKFFEKTINVMLMGEVVRTYIPMEQDSRRFYQTIKTKFLADETKLVLVAYEFDDRGRAYWTKLTFKPGDFIDRSARRNPRNRPEIKLKLKFRRIDPEELNERLLELNV